MSSVLNGFGIKAVVFDAFGTLVRFRQPTHPYRQLFRLAARQGLTGSDQWSAMAMTNNLGFLEFAEFLGASLQGGDQAHLIDLLQREIASIELFGESLSVIERLQASGYAVGVCSNLAQPYGAPLVEKLPSIRHFHLSFDLGLIKPMPQMYQQVCASMGFSPAEILFVGDSAGCDYVGSRLAGMWALHLSRTEKLAESIGTLDSVFDVLNG